MSGRDDELSIPAALRLEVRERDGSTCRFCGGFAEDYTHLHHINYRSHGGKNELENLISLHWQCHGKVHAQKRLWVPILQTLVTAPPNVTALQLRRWVTR